MKIFIRNNWGKIIIGAVIILILLLFPWNCDNKQIATDSKAITDKKIDLSAVEIWKDKYNAEHYKLQRILVDNDVLQVHYDSLAKLLKIKSKQLQSITSIKSGISIDKDLVVTDKVDTIPHLDGTKTIIKYKPFFYKDKWIDIKGDVGKTNKIHIQGQDTLTKTDYWKRKWFLGRKHYYSDFSNKNPYIVIQGLKQVETKPTTSRFSIGPHVGLNFNLGPTTTIQPTIGVSLQYNLIKF